MTTVDMFIIPNPASDTLYDHGMESTTESLRFLGLPAPEYSSDEKNEYGSRPIKDPLVNVWFAEITENEREYSKTPHKSANWGDHGFFLGEERFRGGVMSKDLPASLLEGKKEGDTFELMLKGKHKVTVTCKQLPYRYARFGKFEEVLAKVL